MNWLEMIIGGVVIWLAFIGVMFIIAVVIYAGKKSKTTRHRREKEREEFRKTVIDSVLKGIENQNKKPPRGPLAS